MRAALAPPLPPSFFGRPGDSTRARLCAGSPDGTLIAKILTPAAIANAAFGGPDGDDVMLCASESVWILKVNVRGAGDVYTPGGKL